MGLTTTKRKMPTHCWPHWRLAAWICAASSLLWVAASAETVDLANCQLARSTHCLERMPRTEPLEAMRVSELLGLLSEHGVFCKDCKGAEKREIVEQVKAALAWPV